MAQVPVARQARRWALAVVVCLAGGRGNSSLAQDGIAGPIREIPVATWLDASLAKRGLPVDLQGIVSHIRPGYAIVLQDPLRPHGVFVRCECGIGDGIEQWSRVRVEGKTAVGGFLSDVAASKVTLLGKGVVPPTRIYEQEELAGEEADLVYGEMAGHVLAVHVVNDAPDAGWFSHRLKVMTGNLPVFVQIDRRERIDLEGFVDSVVRVRGTFGVLFNQHRQRIGVRMYVQSPGDLVVVTRPLARGSELPVTPIAAIRTAGSGGLRHNRIRVRATVAYYGAEGLFVQEGSRGLPVEAGPGAAFVPGDKVEVEGYAASPPGQPLRLTDTAIRVIGRGAPPSGEAMTMSGLAEGRTAGSVVTVEGEVTSVFPSESEVLVLLRNSDHRIEARFTGGRESVDFLGGLRPGAWVRVAGVHEKSKPHGKSYEHQLLLRSKADVAVLRDVSIVQLVPWRIVGIAVVLVGGVAFLWIRMLRRLVRLRTEELNQKHADLKHARDVAESASASKSEFLANMSHEIRTPMNAILGMTELALGTNLTHDQRECLELANASGQSLLVLLNDILDFSKVEAGKLQIDQYAFDLNDVLTRTAKTLSLRAKQKGLELLMHLDSGVEDYVIGDPVRVQQVLMNLLGNAIKFTEKGEVLIRVTAQRDEDAERPGQVCLFEVIDSGIGIAKGQLDNIFRAFEQGDSSVTRRYGGTGLGLAISSRLVELMGGRLRVESKQGEGSRFYFALPLRACLRPGMSTPGAKLTPLAGKRVLIVEDSVASQRILMDAVKSWKMIPHLAATGTEALAQLSKPDGNFDLLLLDYKLPDMSGLAMLRRLSEETEGLLPAMVLLSSADTDMAGERPRSLGIGRTLRKPVDRRQLMDAVIGVLEAREDSTLGILKNQASLLQAASVKDAVLPGAISGDAEPVVGPQMPKSGSLRILVAEDNPVNQKLIQKILIKEGHSVTVASDGLEAVDVWSSGSFDVILMDVQMPRASGVDATQEIRKREGGRKTPIIALTAHAMAADRERCLCAGMDDYLTKPISLSALRNALEVIPRPKQGASAENVLAS